MQGIRGLMSLFMVIVIGVACAGWSWAGLKALPTMGASRAALAACAACALGGLALLWRPRPDES
jgi:hypothetical protein